MMIKCKRNCVSTTIWYSPCLISYRRKVKQAKEQQLHERERIKRQTEYDKLTIEKKTEIRKKIQEFRKVNSCAFQVILNNFCSDIHAIYSKLRST